MSKAKIASFSASDNFICAKTAAVAKSVIYTYIHTYISIRHTHTLRIFHTYISIRHTHTYIQDRETCIYTIYIYIYVYIYIL